MKILLLADRMESGGAETHIETLAEGFLQAGHCVGLLSRGGKIADRLAGEGVICRNIPAVGQNPLALLRASAILREEQAKNGYEILHAHTRTSAFLLRGICNPYMRKSPVFVATAHAKFAPSGIKRRLSYWGEQTIAVSEDLRADLIDRYRLPGECVTVVPNGIDERRFFPLPNTAGKGAPVCILFVSRLEPDCSLGAELLCRAAARLAPLAGGDLPPFFVVLAGGGSRFSAIAALAGRVNLALGAPLVRVVKPQSPADLIALYRRADLFVGVSRAAMEAAFCGCAVLLCGNEGYGGLLTPKRLDLAAGNFCCRGLPAATVESLTADLAALLRSPALRQTAAEWTGAWLRRDFSAAGMCRATEEVYRRARLRFPHGRGQGGV